MSHPRGTSVLAQPPGPIIEPVPASAPLPATRRRARDFAAGGLKVGVVSGLGYRNQCGGLDKVTRFLDEQKVPHRVARTPDDVAEVIADFERQGIDLLTVNGGDGTLSMVVTTLLRRGPSDDAPLLAVLAGGRTNMSAGDLGLPGSQIRRLGRLLAWAKDGGTGHRLNERSVLGVDLGDGNPRRYGFFFGGAAIYHGSVSTWSFRDGSKVPGMRTGLGTAVNVARIVTGHLRGRSLFPSSRIRVRLDGEELEQSDYAMVFATSLDRMAMGLRPYWGKNEGTLRFTGVAGDHRHLVKAGLSGMRGRANRFLTPENGYFSRNAEEIEFLLDGEGGVLDGELVTPVKGNPVRLRADRRLTFVQV